MFGPVIVAYYSKRRRSLPATAFFIMINFVTNNHRKVVLWKTKSIFSIVFVFIIGITLVIINSAAYERENYVQFFFLLISCLLFVWVVCIIKFILVNFIRIVPLIYIILTCVFIF